MHASFLQDMQTGAHLQDSRPPPPPRHDPFATLDDHLRTRLVKDIFLHKYLSTSPAPQLTTFDDIHFKDHDSLFDWIKQRLNSPDYTTKPNGISYWEYDACYDELKEIFFFFSPIMASTALKLFIEFHTRRMSATHLRSDKQPFFFTEKFPVSKLQHLSINIDADTGKGDESPRFHALIKAIPTLHDTFTGLKTLKVEINPKAKTESDANFVQSKEGIQLRAYIQKVAVMLSLEKTKRLAHVALRYGEQMVFCGDWHFDQEALVILLSPGYAMPKRLPSDSLPVALRWPLGSKNGPKVHY